VTPFRRQPASPIMLAPMRTPVRRLHVLARAAFVACVACLVFHFAFLRPMQMRWGATDAEAARALPGDKVVGNATFVATRAMTVEALPEQIWPLIVQKGTAERRFVKGFEANRYMLWQTRSTPRLTWCWTLSPAGPGRTRVVTRVRFRHAWMSPAAWRVLAADLGNFYEVRRALMDIKAGAEGTPRKTAAQGS
jgi:hypothetical protein